MVRLLLMLILLFVAPAIAEPGRPFMLAGDPWSAEVDPATLRVVMVDGDGGRTVLSDGQDSLGPVQQLERNGDTATWRLPDARITVRCQLRDAELTIRFIASDTGRFTWPIIDSSEAIAAFILPTFEGVYVPTDDAEWIDFLDRDEGYDTTADLSMPFWGLDLGDRTVAYIVTYPFNNRLKFRDYHGRLAARFTHEFMPNRKIKEYGLVIRIGAASPIDPAKQYRRYLIDRGEFVTMAEKIRNVPKAERLLGAAHVYVWDAGLISRHDVNDWKAFCAALKADEQMWPLMSEEGRDAADQIIELEWPYAYVKDQVCNDLNRLFEEQIEPAAFAETYAAFVNAPATWGNGISTKMLDRFADAGFDRMCISLGDLSAANRKPHVAARADELGYLFGPYDSYHSIHHPDAGENDTWETAQFDMALYQTGPIVGIDGKKRPGFKKRGYKLSPLAARPYVERRVNGIMDDVPFTAWFVDCDAYGEFYDDYSPLHPATQTDGMRARLDRLAWVRDAHQLVIGSEGGSAYAAPVIHFAHGMTTPVIGWGDPDLKQRDSDYYLGGYWPPDGPRVHTMQVPLHPKYQRFYYDPRFRLPLYQIVFHDSVIATHHWGYASLKFIDQVETVALLEQLYNVPPLYHMNLDEFRKHREHLRRHYAFFSPLHRELALLPMTDFEWLSADRKVQRTTFGDAVTIIVNFGDEAFNGVPPRSAVATRRDTGERVTYTP